MAEEKKIQQLFVPVLYQKVTIYDNFRTFLLQYRLLTQMGGVSFLAGRFLFFLQVCEKTQMIDYNLDFKCLLYTIPYCFCDKLKFI